MQNLNFTQLYSVNGNNFNFAGKTLILMSHQKSQIYLRSRRKQEAVIFFEKEFYLSQLFVNYLTS